MTRHWLVNGVAFALLWLFVRGVPVDPPVRLVEEFVIGLGVGTAVAFGFRRLYAPRVSLLGVVRAAPPALLYLLTFLKELVVANLTVASIVLSPSMPINPRVVEVPLRVRSDAAVTTIANSITLTPGTLTMDHDRETNALYVHSINVTDEASVLDPIRTWEDYALRIFDEEADPGDPAPDGRPAHERGPGATGAGASGTDADADSDADSDADAGADERGGER